MTIEKAKKNERGWAVMMAANFVLDHDENIEDSFKVECLLREKHPKPKPKITKQFVAEVMDAAHEQRNRNQTDALFARIEHTVEAWPAEASEDFVEMVADELVDIIARIADDDWSRNGAIETKAARYAALLLVKQVAQRKWQAELDAASEESA